MGRDPDHRESPAEQRAAAVRAHALALGFEAVGIAAVAPLAAREHYEAWLAAGRHGGLDWIASPRHRERRHDPERMLRTLRAVVCVAMLHPPGRAPERDARLGRIARYAAGDDYHEVMGERLHS